MAKARYVAFRPETTFATYNGAATPVYPRLIGDDAFEVQPIPQFADIRTADSNNRLISKESTRYVSQGKLTTFLYPEQAAFFLGLALDVDGTSGELDSISADYFDGLVYYQQLGLKVKSLMLEASAESDEGIFKLSLDLWGKKPGVALNSGTFPQPDGADFPQTGPYKLIHSKSGFTCVNTGSTTRTQYRSLKLTVDNILSYNFDEDEYPTDITYHGRNIHLDSSIRFTSNSERTWFEGKTALICKIILARGVSPALVTSTIDLLTKNIMVENRRSQPLSSPMYQDVKIHSVVDGTSGVGNDASWSVVTS